MPRLTLLEILNIIQHNTCLMLIFSNVPATSFMRGLGGIFFVIGSLLLLNGWYMRYRLGTEMTKAVASPARTGHEAAVEANVRHLPIADQQVFEFNADLVIHNHFRKRC